MSSKSILFPLYNYGKLKFENNKIFCHLKNRNIISLKLLYGKNFSYTILFYFTLFAIFLLNFVEGTIDLPICTRTQVFKTNL